MSKSWPRNHFLLNQHHLPIRAQDSTFDHSESEPSDPSQQHPLLTSPPSAQDMILGGSSIDPITSASSSSTSLINCHSASTTATLSNHNNSSVVSSYNIKNNNSKQDDHRKRKRNRTMQSCLPCHTNKRRCDRGRPCSRCTGLGTTGHCVYETEDPKFHEKNDKSDPAWETQRLRDRVAELEGVVRQLKGRPDPKKRTSITNHQNQGPSPNLLLTSPTSYGRAHSQSVSGVPWSPTSTSTSNLEHFRAGDGGGGSSVTSESSPASPSFESTSYSQVQSQRQVNFDNGDDRFSNHSSSGSTEIYDHKFGMGVGVGVGGSGSLVGQRRASCPPEYFEEHSRNNVFQDDEDGPKVFLGGISGGNLIKKINGLTSPSLRPRTLHTQNFASSASDKTDLITAQAAYRGLFGGSKRWAFDIQWGDGPRSIVECLNAILPTRENTKELFNIWLEEVDCFQHGWHTPTVKSYYDDFFNLPTMQEKQKFPTHKLSVIVAIITVTIDISPHIIGDKNARQRYESEAEYQKALKEWQTGNSQLLASLTVDCLKKSSYLGHPSLECIQAQLILLLYMVNNGRCTDAWCFTGGFIKQAQCLGLHIDPEDLDPTLSLLDKEVRRRIWWAIQTWDTSLSIAFGWPTGVTASDTDLPQDRTEDSLFGACHLAADPPLPERGITDLTYHVYNWEAYQYAHHMMDKIFHQARWRWRDRHRKNPKPSYDDIEELDKTIRAWYKRIPANMRFEPEAVSLKSTPGVTPDLSSYADLSDLSPSSSCVSAQDIRNRHPMWAKQSLMLAISENAILLLLHRPFIGQSTDRSAPKAQVNQRSRDQLRSEVKCLRSSQVIIQAQGLLAELFPTTHRMWYGWYKTFHAAMTSAWISQLHPNNHPIFQVGERCLELAIEAFEIAVVDQKEASDPKVQVPDDHLSACNQLRAVWKFISRDSDAKSMPISNVKWASYGVPAEVTSYIPNLNAKDEWPSPETHRLYMSPVGQHCQHQTDINFTSSTAPYFGASSLRPLHHTYPQYTPQFQGASVSPQHSLSPQTLHTSPASVHDSSESQSGHNSSVQASDVYDQDPSSSSNSRSHPSYNHTLYQSNHEPLDSHHRQGFHSSNSGYGAQDQLAFKNFFPPTTNSIFGPTSSYQQPQQTLYTPAHSFGFLQYNELNSQMSTMLMVPQSNVNNNDNGGVGSQNERLDSFTSNSGSSNTGFRK